MVVIVRAAQAWPRQHTSRNAGWTSSCWSPGRPSRNNLIELEVVELSTRSAYDITDFAAPAAGRAGWTRAPTWARYLPVVVLDQLILWAGSPRPPQLNDRIRTTTVVAVDRVGFDRIRTAGREAAPFLIRLAGGAELLASAVIDAAGTLAQAERPRRFRHPRPR